MYLKYFFVLYCLFCSFYASGQSYEQWLDLYFTHIEMDSLEAAEQDLKQALKKDPTNIQNSMLLSNLGTIQRRLGKNEDALVSYNSALSILPNSTVFLMNRAALFAEMNRMDDALNDYSRVLSLDGKIQDAYYLRGLVYIEKKDTVNALYDFNRLLKINPNSSNGRLGLAAIHKLKREYAKSIYLYTEVLKQNPTKASIYASRSETYLLDGKPKKALEDINKAISLKENDPLFFYIRARVFLALYEKENAKTNLEKAQNLGFDEELIDLMLKQL